MIKLTKEQILMLHSELIKMTGCSALEILDYLNLPQKHLFNPMVEKELSDLILDVAADKKQYEDILQWLLVHQI